MRMPEVRMINGPNGECGNVKDYETIKGLFIGLKNWHLLCRVTKVDYQEFRKKNNDKLHQKNQFHQQKEEKLVNN